MGKAGWGGQSHFLPAAKFPAGHCRGLRNELRMCTAVGPERRPPSQQLSSVTVEAAQKSKAVGGAASFDAGVSYTR